MSQVSTQMTLDEKLEHFLSGHRRILEQFDRSLENARHFIALANKSREQEPLETLEMLEQIREIDLLNHLQVQFEEFQQIASFFRSDPGGRIEGATMNEINGLEERYESALREAEGQMTEIEQLLFTMQNHH